ncbi:hypothetical protein PC112_g20373, partial [Phytophthora cactorum]
MKSTDTPGRWNRDNDSDQVEEALYTKSSTKFSSRCRPCVQTTCGETVVEYGKDSHIVPPSACPSIEPNASCDVRAAARKTQTGGGGVHDHQNDPPIAQKTLDSYYSSREDDLFKRIRFEFDLSEKRSILQAYAEYEQFEQNENIHRERRELAV